MLNKSASEKVNAEVEKLASKLRRRQVVGAFSCALETSRLFLLIAKIQKGLDASELRNLVAEKGKVLCDAQPVELSIGNIVIRVKNLIQEEDQALPLDMDVAERRESLKTHVVDALLEMKDEVENATNNIASQALEHIHSNEIIMTIGRSPVVESFLLAAGKLRKFQVIVAETSPTYDGQALALKLSQEGVDTTLITDAAIFAVMSRVNKVILGTHAVLANGGLVAISGSHVVASAAKHHSTPVLVLAELYKISNVYPFDADEFTMNTNPDSVFGFENGSMIDSIEAINPSYDLIDPDLVNLFLTNEGAYPPSYVPRLIYEDSL